MNKNHSQFMVDFTLPRDLSEEFISLIPQQRNVVNQMLCEGKLLTYALSLENHRLWAVFSVESEADLMEQIHRLPLTPYLDIQLHDLTFYNASHSLAPAFSVN